MRASVTSLTKKFISTFFAATLALGLVPAAAFAANEPAREESPQNVISSEVGEADEVEKSALIEQNETEGLTASFGEDEAMNDATGSDDSNLSIPAATQRVNEDVTLSTRTVAQAESTRSYFLAQTLESTRTVPIVSANLPLDMTASEPQVPETDAPASDEGEEGEGSDESDLVATPIAAESVVIGSFEYRGITYAVEPGGESVAVVAADYSKLPKEFIEAQTIVLPSMVTSDGIDYYSVTRIADNAFASLTKENADPDFKGCEALFTDEELLAEAGIDASEVDAFLNPESDMVDIDGDGEADAPANPLKDCTGILALGIPASVTSIGDEAFAGFDTLQYLVVSEDDPEHATFDGVLYDADLANLRLIPEGRVGAVRVAPSATDVDPEVFSHCPSVTTLVADPESGSHQLLKENVFLKVEDSDLNIVDSATADPKLSDLMLLGIVNTLAALLDETFSQTNSFNLDVRASLGVEETLEVKFPIYMQGVEKETGCVIRICSRKEVTDSTTGEIFIPPRKANLFYCLGNRPVGTTYGHSGHHSRKAGIHEMFSAFSSATPVIYWKYSSNGYIENVCADGSARSEYGFVRYGINAPEQNVIKAITMGGRKLASGSVYGQTAAECVLTLYYNYSAQWDLPSGAYFVDADGTRLPQRTISQTKLEPEDSTATYTLTTIPSIEVPAGTRLQYWLADDWEQTKVYPGDSSVILNDITIFNPVLETGHLITFDDERGANGAQSFNALVRDSTVSWNKAVCPQSVAMPTRLGYSFDGYYEKVYSDDERFDQSAAVFTEANGRTYNKNFWYQGSAVGDAMKVTRANDGKNIPEEIVSDVTLYAEWTRDITLDTQGAKSPANDQKVHVTWGDGMPTAAIAGDDTCSSENGPANHGTTSIVVPVKDGYEFCGFWSTKYDESDPSKQYYEVKDGAVAPVEGKTWDIDQDRLYAHWKYRIVLNDNAYDSEGHKVAASVDWGSFASASGAGFAVVREGEGAPYIEVVLGAPIPLPKATRAGYGDTRAWGLTSGSNGKAGWVVKETSDFWTAKADGTKASLADASYTKNGAATENYSVTPGIEDHTLLLFASWLWDETTPDSDKVVPGGGKNKYDVRLKAAYKTAGVTYSASWPQGTTLDKGDVVLSDVEYDAVIPDTKITMGAPSFVSVSGIDHDSLAFKGFYTAPNVPVPAEGEGFEGVLLIAPSADDPSGLSGAAPLRVLPDEGADEIVLYALWALPVTNVVFHLNAAGLESTVTYAQAMADPTKIVRQNGKPYTVSVKTNEVTPTIAFAMPTNGAYVFNGWWTHPYLEGPGSTQYYGDDNRPIEKDGKVLAWKPYVDTVLYAHWKYKIVLDANVPADATGADDVKLQHLAQVGDYTGSAVEGVFAGDVLTDSSCGNAYHYEAVAEGTPAQTYLAQADGIAIDAILGAPVKLPFARFRIGYDDTVVWNDATGKTVAVAKDGWTSATLGGTEVAAMRFSGAPDATTHAITLYADWSGFHEDEGFGGGPKKYTVNLVAAYDGITLTGKDETAGTTKLDNVAYDAVFSESAKNGRITAPFRNGYTFLGYYTIENPNVTDETVIRGDKWIEPATDKLAETAVLSKAIWNLVPASGKTEIDLYAAWKKDSYLIEYAPTALNSTEPEALLTPGNQKVEVGPGMPESMVWSYGEKMSLLPDFPRAAAAPTAISVAETPFFRNGYTFDGWYFTYTDTDGEKATQMVSDSLGRGDAAYVWEPTREWQVANRGAGTTVLTLYGAWTAKIYALMFDANLPDSDATSPFYPLEEWYGDAAHKNVEKTTDGDYYYKVAYEDTIAPCFSESGVPIDPSYLDYTFAFWGTDKDDSATASNPKNKLVAADAEGTYRFTPAFELKAANANNGRVNIITYYAHWAAPAAATVTLFADTSDRTGIDGAPAPRGHFTDDNVDYAGASATASDDKKLVLEEVTYGTPLPMNQYKEYRPAMENGYRFYGWVRANENGEAIDDANNVVSAYDAKTGEPDKSLLVKDSDTRYLKGANYYVAVYSRAPYTVTLDMNGYDKYNLVTSSGVAWDTLEHSFNVESATFSLPTDVRIDGQKFVGWKRTKPAPAKMWNGTDIVPTDAASEVGAEAQTFVPVFADRIYRVDFVARNAATGQGDVLSAYVDFNGTVLGGSLVDAKQASVGETLQMPAAPKSKLRSSSNGVASSYIFTAWRTGTTQLNKGDDLKANATGLTAAQWKSWLTKHASALAAPEKVTIGTVSYEVTDAMSVYGIWDSSISAVCPLYVTVAVDVENGAVAIPEGDFGIYGTSSADELSVAALRYDPIVQADDAGKVNAFASASEAAHLNVFVSMKDRPEMKTPTIEAGVIKGEFGKQTSAAHAKPLQIDLREPSRVYTEKDLAGYGFRAFTNGESDAAQGVGGKLYLWYGLDLDGMKLDTLRTIGSYLPRIQDGYETDKNGWTKQSVPVARLCYTVQLAPKAN